MSRNLPHVRGDTRITRQERDKFMQFLRQATDAQVRNIYIKETNAPRPSLTWKGPLPRQLYADLAEQELERRGIDIP